MAKYTHMFDFVFEVESNKQDPIDVSRDHIIQALEGRLKKLKANKENTFDYVNDFDSYEND